MQFGYIRVSTEEQNLDLQKDAFKRLGCDKLFIEKISGVAKHRPQWEELRKSLRSGDTVVVWDISRLGRNTKEMYFIIEEWQRLGILFKSIQEPFIDTTTEMGEFIFKLFSLLAETERKRIRRRTIEGVAAARARGRFGGRPSGLNAEALKKASLAKKLYVSKEYSVAEICSITQIKSKATLYKYLKLSDG